MRDVETLRTVYSTFSRSTVKRGKMEDLAKILDENTLSFRPLNDVRWLSRHQAVNAILRNYTMLKEFCKKEFTDKRSTGKVLLQKAEWFKVQGYCHCFGRCFGWASTTLPHFTKTQPNCDGRTLLRAKNEKLRSQYLKEKDVQWSDRVKEAMGTSSADGSNTGEITLH